MLRLVLYMQRCYFLSTSLSPTLFAMAIKHLILWIVCSCWCSICVLAQPKTGNKTTKSSTQSVPKRAQELFAQSSESYQYERYDEAIALLQKAIKRYPRYEQAYKRIATIAWEQHQYSLATDTYRQVERLFPTSNNRMYVRYYLAKMAYEQQQYDTTIDYATQAIAIKDSARNVKDLSKNLQSLLANAQFAQHALQHPVAFQPIRLDSSVNSPYDEYLPTLTADEQLLVFTRRMKGDFNINEDFYSTARQGDTTWRQAIPLQTINTKGDEGAICISPDGNRLFFAARDRTDGLGNFDLYYCLKAGENWDGPYNMGQPINSRGWESQPCISADGTELYFCSKRSDGNGGIDIWCSRLMGNHWAAPFNLGSNINTNGNEQSPFIHPDGQTLYFSSNGHIGMGDADLYLSRRQNDGTWGKAENLGYPINTPDNENGLVVSSNGERAYYSSFNDTSGLDLYYFRLPAQVKPQLVNYIKGSVFDAQNPKKRLSATITLTDLSTGQEALRTVSDTNSGDFLLTLPVDKDYMYNVSREGYAFFSEHFALQNAARNSTQQQPYLLQIALQPLPTDTSPLPDKAERIVLRNVFFETDSYALQSQSQPELNKLADLLLRNTQLRIEIGGHTDSTGTAAHNLRLSADRAKAVADYLSVRGIASSRLSYQGYGSSRPLAPNSTPEGRATNRRTDFVLLNNSPKQP